MPIPLAQNFYKETVTTVWTTGGGNFYVSNKPSISEGYLVLSPSSANLREIVKFTAVGSDGGGDYVTILADDRGLGGTTEQAHQFGESVYINVVAEHIKDLSDALDQIVDTGAQYATENTIGTARLNSSPNVSLGTATVTIASPAVVSFTAHGLVANDTVELTTDGSLPTGVIASTTYYVISAGLTANSFQISATLGGTAIDTSGSQSGTHTLFSTTPIAIGPNDPLLPSADQSAALAGGEERGVPSVSNKFQTEQSTPSVRRTMTAGETIAGDTTPVPVYQNKTDNEFYACDANDDTKYKFIGFAVSAGIDTNDIDIQFSGVVSGFTGLSEGEKYYVQDAVGTIGTSIGTHEILVGVAISETELEIYKGDQFDAGSGALGTASGSSVVTLGFRPKVIRVIAKSADNSVQFADMHLTWANGTIKAIARSNGGNTVTTFARLNFGTGSTAYLEFTITSVTDTGFTLTWTETGSTSWGAAGYFWEAQGSI